MILDKVTKGSFVLRLILGFIFLFSALTKLYDYSEFLYFVSEFFWVNNLLLITVTSILIAVELCLAFGFLVKTDTKVTSIIVSFPKNWTSNKGGGQFLFSSNHRGIRFIRIALLP